MTDTEYMYALELMNIFFFRPLLIDSDVTVSTLGQKSSRVLGEK
jgi:hypothetical protein